MNNLFFTNSIMVREMPTSFLIGDPPAYHGQDEAIQKIHRFCHEIYNMPITWLCCNTSIHKYKDLWKEYIEKYGDEVAVLEWGMFTKELVGDEAERYQSWVERAGITRPSNFIYNDELQNAVGFHNMNYDDIYKAIKFFKEDFKETLGVELKTFANAFVDNRTIKVMREFDIPNVWGYNWNYFCEGINNKGCPPVPFYISDENHNVPAKDTTYPVGVHWGGASHVISYHTDKMCRQGGAGHCLNALEMTNRSYGLDKIDFHKKVIKEYADNAKWNPCMHVPLQLEAIWFDEGAVPAELGVYDQYPQFNSHNTETYYSQLEECLKVGAKPVTVNSLCDWYRANVKPGAETVLYSEDLVPDLRHKGKDTDLPPLVVYQDNKNTYWFSKDRKFNYIRKYDYTEVPTQVITEYPYESEPEVALQAKHMLNPTAGLRIIDDKCKYELNDFHLSSYGDYKDYCAIIWQSNIPDYIKDEDIKIGGFVNRFKNVKEKNLSLLFGDLKDGVNTSLFESDKPNDYVKIVSSSLVGKRYEIWIENKGCESDLIHIETNIAPGLKIGGYWWNGEFNHSCYRFGWNDYNQKTGRFLIKVFYPITFKLKTGLNRLSIETF